LQHFLFFTHIRVFPSVEFFCLEKKMVQDGAKDKGKTHICLPYSAGSLKKGQSLSLQAVKQYFL